LNVRRCPEGVTTEAGPHVVYDVGRDEAHFGAARVEGDAIIWEIDERPEGDWLVRCDRVDFPPGGVAYRHTHPGPGVRVLLKGRIRIDSGGESHEYGPREWWYESGPEPVFAAASPDEVRSGTSTPPTTRSRSSSGRGSTSKSRSRDAPRAAGGVRGRPRRL